MAPPAHGGLRDHPSGRPLRSPPARSGGEAASHARPGGAGAPGRPARLGSVTSQTSGIRSIRTAKGGEQEAAPRHRRGRGRGRPQGPQDAPSPRVPDPGLRHPESPGQAARNGPQIFGLRQPPLRIWVLRLRHNRVSTGPRLLHTKRSISQSSGCATLQGPRGPAFDRPESIGVLA